MKSKIAQTFLNFAEYECKGSSLLYEYLSEKIAADEELLELCMNVRQDQPVPNTLFGAVHYLLLKGINHPLKEYYPSITERYKKKEEAFQPFKDFCIKYKDDILSIFKIRYIQTNEVRRCAYLYPAFCTVYEKTEKPLALIEIGTSAGLQLLWDQYSYSYGDDNTYGNTSSALHIESKLVGEKRPALHKSSPPVTSRIGLDLNPIDLNNEDEKLWLKSLIWPEHTERLDMFEKAASSIKNNNISLIEGDGIALLPEYAAKIATDNAICIFHTHVANQMPVDKRNELVQAVKEIGRNRDVFHLYNNIQDRYLHLDYYINGEENNNIIAETEGHGRWFEWY